MPKTHGKANHWSSDEIINIAQLHLVVSFKLNENSSGGQCLAPQNNAEVIDTSADLPQTTV